MSALQDQLRPASFRGVPFQVDGSDMETGRRVQVNEYPQKDKPYVQDLGRSTRNLKFDAFVIGADYVAKANALLGALEEFGSGQLIHPWFGTLKVNVTSCSVAFDRGLGHARFSLSFVESGDLEFPTAADSTAELSRTAAQGLEDSSTGWFGGVFKVAGFVQDVSDKALGVYTNVMSALGNPAFALASLTGYGSLLGNLTALQSVFNNPPGLGLAWASLLNLSSMVSDGKIVNSGAVDLPIVRGLIRMVSNPALVQPTIATPATATAAQILTNQKAILANTRHLLLVQAVMLSSYLRADIYDDTLQAKNELAAALDAETLLATNDDVYQALMAARKAMWNDLTVRSRNSARLLTITPPDVLPAVVIAYDQHEDAGRDLEIVARNKLRHPGFVPVMPIRVLSA